MISQYLNPKFRRSIARAWKDFRLIYRRNFRFLVWLAFAAYLPFVLGLSPELNRYVTKLIRLVIPNADVDLTSESFGYAILIVFGGVATLVLTKTLTQSFSSVLRYLERSDPPTSAYSSTRQLDELQRAQSRLEEQIQRLRMNVFSGVQHEVSPNPDLVETHARRLVEEQLKTIDAGEIIKSFELTIQNKLKEESRKSAIADMISEQFSSMKSRLLQEIGALSRRANVNLVLGMFISILGIGLLGVFVFQISATVSERTLAEVIIIQSTRLGLVILIEIFAYFFLRLYRYSLFEIKYFQNEITSGEFKIIALHTALRLKTEATTSRVLENLAKYERNSILRRGETTAEILREEISAKAERNTLSALEKFAARFQKAPKGI